MPITLNNDVMCQYWVAMYIPGSYVTLVILGFLKPLNTHCTYQLSKHYEHITLITEKK